MSDPKPPSRCAAAMLAYGQAAGQVVLAFGAYALAVGGLLLADSASVQRIPFGVAALCVLLGALMHALCALVKKWPWLLPSNIGGAFVDRAHTPLIALAVLAPLAISWSSNETLYGALNPIGYWREQASRTYDTDCEFMRSALAHSAEKYQVTSNKYNMGIATSNEVRDAAESLKLLSEIHTQCVQAEAKRTSKADMRLKELEQGSR